MATRTQAESLMMIGLIVVAGMAVIGWVLPGTSSGGSSSCPTSPASPCWTKVQSGTGTCTVNAGASSCTTVITFSPAYSSTPTIIGLSNSGGFPTSRLSTGAFAFIQNSTQWTAFPSASTELLGSTNYRWNFSSVFSTAPFLHARVLTGGTLGTEQLQLQRSTDGAVTWANVNGCSLTFGTGTGDFFSGGCVALSGSTAHGVEFRIMGSGGNSTGPPSDNPVFQSIYVELSKSINTGDLQMNAISTTTMTIQVQLTGIETLAVADTFFWNVGLKA